MMMSAPQPTATPTFPESWVLEPYKPTPHLLQLEHRNQRTGKTTTSEYLPVKQRLVWFVTEQRQLIAAGLATTTYIVRPRLVEHDSQNGQAVFECYIRDVLGNEATDYGSESRADWRDYLEKASTKATGRALAALGYGTSFAPELDEEDRIADSPEERPAKTSAARPAQEESAAQPPRRPAPAQERQAQGTEGERMADEQQLLSIRKLCASLGREEPAPGVLTYTGAGALIKQLSREYNNRRRAG
jgi:hypothetical protein